MPAVSVTVGIALIIYVGYRLYQLLFPPPNISPNAKYVLISGCDTGFGHALAIDLDKQGFHVLAGVYNRDNEEHLTDQLSPRATVFPLDITKEDEIDAAFEIVKSKTPTLHALVNNAGVGECGLIDWTSNEFIRQIMDVNFFGHVAMTKKFLPLLISRRASRVVNLSSVYGYISGPGVSAYACSKHALEAFSDSLRREMHDWGLHVSIIEPGYMRTPLIDGLDQALRDLWAELPVETKLRWGDDYLNDVIKEMTKNPFILSAEIPSKVVRAVRDAVMSTAPRIRYRPGWQSSLLFFPLSTLPAWLSDYFLRKLKVGKVLPAGLLDQQD